MLTGKIAVVTGASRGIGKEIAKTLAAKGATVVVNYNGSAEKAEETVKEIEALGGKAEALQCNVSDYDKAAEMMAYVVKTYGRVDILVNNAGITRDNLLMKMSEEDFDAVLNTNLKGAFNCIKHISRQMLKQKSGHIVNISSVSGVMGNAGQVNYSASKAGVIGMTKAVAREMASRGITCNAYAHTERIFLAHIKTCILNSLSGCSYCELAELLHSLCCLRIHELLRIEILNLCCQLCLVICRVKIGDRCNTDFLFL